MLQAIRGKTASIVVKALAGLLIVAFAAWGVEDFIGARATETYVASVGDQEIRPQDFEVELSRETQRLRSSFGGRLSDEQLINLGVGNAVLQRMINDAALAQKARDMGLLVSNDRVTEAIHADPSFQGADARFSRLRFDEVMRAIGMSEAAYIEQVRADIAANQLFQAFGASDAAPRELATLLRAYRFEQRTAETLLIATADQPDPGTPTDEQLKMIYDAQSERFTAPEYRKITFVHLDPAALTSDVAVTDEELKAAYDANAAQFIQPELRTVQQMVLDDEESAKKAEQQLREGRSFEDVATEIAGMEKAAIDLGTVSSEGLLPKLADAVFAVPVNVPTTPIETPLGWHILRATKIEPGVEKTLDRVRDQVRDIVAREKAVEGLYDLSIRFEDAIGGGASLEEAANSVGLNATTIDAVDRNGMAPSGATAAGLPEIASLLPVAFSTDEKLDSQLTEIGDKGYFMVRVDSVIPPALKPLDTVRDEVAEAWRAQQRSDAAKEKAQQFAEKITAGTPMPTLAEGVPSSVEAIGPMTRDGSGDVERTVVTRMFEIAPGTSGIAQISSGYVVVHVTQASPPEGDGVPSIADFDKQLDQTVGNDIAAQMIAALRAEYGVEVNQRVYQAVLKPGNYDPLNPS